MLRRRGMTLHSMERRHLSHLQPHAWGRGERGCGEDAEDWSGREDRALSQLDGTAELYILSIVTASYITAGRKKQARPFSPLFRQTVSMRACDIVFRPRPSLSTTVLVGPRLPRPGDPGPSRPRLSA